MKLYIIDIIGRHSGMHYYNESFYEILNKNGIKAEFLTNYCDSSACCVEFFRNQYEGALTVKAGRFIRGLFKLYSFFVKNRKDCFIYYFYGNLYEHFYIFPLILLKRSVIDVHDLTSMASGSILLKNITRKVHKLFFSIYKGNVIIHVEQTGQIIKDAGFKGEMFMFPHLQYKLDKNYDKEAVRPEVLSLIEPLKTNLLFFGYIRESKGPDTVIDLARLMVREGLSGRFNLIIAGNDPQKIISRLIDSIPADLKLPISIFLHYVNDDELKFLFSSVDYILLPYREISQSGVLEMAVHFRKPVITSNLAFFSGFLKEFKSFGRSSEGDNPKDYLETLIKIEKSDQKEKTDIYTPDDLKKYENSKKESSINLLINKIESIT